MTDEMAIRKAAPYTSPRHPWIVFNRRGQADAKVNDGGKAVATASFRGHVIPGPGRAPLARSSGLSGIWWNWTGPCVRDSSQKSPRGYGYTARSPV